MDRITVLLSLISISSSSIVRWVPDRSFNLPTSFQSDELPCSKVTVVFPETLHESITIANDTSVRGLILPREGEIVLVEGDIVLGADQNDYECINGGYVNFAEDSVVAWTQANAWSSDRFNEATPDAERIPCYDDIVEFPEKAQFAVQLPDTTQNIREIRVGGRRLTDNSDLRDFLQATNHETQVFVRSESYIMELSLNSAICKLQAGCPCQEHPPTIECGTKFCPKLMCLNPVKPMGFCCNVCGGYIIFDIQPDFHMVAFKHLVDKIVTSFGGDKLAYHIGRLPDHNTYSNEYNSVRYQAGKVQVVVVEKGEYTGTSAVVINDIHHNLQVTGKSEAVFSGSPIHKSGLGGKIFISMFFIVAAVMGVIYLYYYKLPTAWVTNISFPLPGLLRPGLSRFQRSESVVTLTRRDSVVSGVGGF